ncbi:MAG: epoxyqueuosine reductase QueH [Spirochaetales bacterium]|nr:epoxyqueuosine reductase QueH [Spirochaetales bacterium]
MKEKLLLHVCCGPCAVGSIPAVDDMDVVLYFANSNIDTNDEFEKRFDAANAVSSYYKKEIIKEEYNHGDWLDSIKGLENEPEKGSRCLKCFRFSFELAAKKAKEEGIKYFTSTLTISPHKNSNVIINIGKEVGAEYGVEYYEHDFAKNNGYNNSVKLSKELGLYRQKYCGCEYSIWWKK